MLWTLLFCLAFLPVSLWAQTQPVGAAPSPSAAAVAPIENPKTPEEFFARARRMSDLEASGIPFHLKATYVASGDTEFTGNGTYEEWWQSKDVWRKEATLDDYKYVAIKNGGQPSVFETSAYTPLRLRQAMRAVIDRIPAKFDNSCNWQISQEKLNGIDFPTVTSKGGCQKWNARVPSQDYFTSQGILQVRREGPIITIYNDFQPFQDIFAAHSIIVAVDGSQILNISIVSLEAFTPTKTTLFQATTVPANMHSVAIPVGIKLRPGVEPSKLIHQVNPSYPKKARYSRIEGTVVVVATIDESGKIREPYVLVSVEPSLDAAALKAVRQWRYKPLRIDGTPYAVETTISLAFH